MSQGQTNDEQYLIRTDDGAKRNLTHWIVLVVPALLVGVWLRGPFFGLIFAAIISCPIPFVLAKAGWLNSASRFRRRVQAGILLLTPVVVWTLLRPPTPNEILLQLSGHSLPAGVSVQRQWNDVWGKDVAYLVRFRANSDAVAELANLLAVSELPDLEDSHVSENLTTRVFHLSLYESHEQGSVAVWENGSPWAPANPIVCLYYSRETQIGYISVIYL